MTKTETPQQKMYRQFMSLSTQIECVIRDNEIFNIAVKIGMFDIENEGVFIVNDNGGNNYTCSRLTANLYDRLAIKRKHLQLEDREMRYFLAQLNKNNSPKIIMK